MSFTLAKTLQNSPTKSENWTRKKIIQNAIFEVYLLISDYFAENRQRLAKTSSSSYNPTLLKKPHPFHEPQLTKHYKIYNPVTQPKTFVLIHI